MTVPPTLTPQLIGQTENALRALMNRVLASTGGTFHQWVTLKLLATGGEPVGLDHLATRIAGALKIDHSAALGAIDELTAAHLLRRPPDQAPSVGLTREGHAHHRRLQAAIDEIAVRLFDDLPPDDLTTTARILTLVTARADAELARADRPQKLPE